MIRTVLIDDEIDSIRVLQKLLESFCPEVSIVGTADGVETAATLIRSVSPDLALLDIEMVGGNAFDLLNQLQPIDFKVIFVTAFDDYALRAFKYSAVDYLLKPIDIDDLRTAIARVSSTPVVTSFDQQLKMLMKNLEGFQQAQQKIAIPTITGLVFVPFQDIVRFEGRGGYTNIYLSGGELIVATRAIKEYEEMLPESVFFRVHNSQIINLHKMQRYNKGRGGEVVMEDGSVIEVASRRRDEFLRRLMK
ncbi:LytR/AlgR family response regulator transcription factor [Puia sp. P3]|uniref:LytR/AlgR family response regulator transcription factor n=1 Tax=Puia sp. P3 TaxID=3423952 RepID=UPI003D671409